jgi:hypothetical protein
VLEAVDDEDDSDDDESIESIDGVTDLRNQLRSQQKAGVSHPNGSCTNTGLTSALEAIALTQYNLKRGLKEFGKDGIDALGKEMEQLHMRKVEKPVDASKLTPEGKKATLQYLMFMTKKRCGRIKARGCADGRKQRETTSKEEASACHSTFQSRISQSHENCSDSGQSHVRIL